MTKKEQEEHFDKFVQKMKDTLISKGDDYANVDRLSNFKLSGSIIGKTPQDICLGQMAIKISRLGVLTNSNKVNNESISDSILDLANYAVLLDMINEDTKPKPF